MTDGDARPLADTLPDLRNAVPRPGFARTHHRNVHGVSLKGIPREKWTEHVEKHADTVENPEGRTAKERELAPHHPAYTITSDQSDSGYDHDQSAQSGWPDAERGGGDYGPRGEGTTPGPRLRAVGRPHD